MSFNLAEARLKTIKKLQAQLNEFERGCYPRKEQKTYTIDAHSHHKAMKDLMRLSEENIWMRKEIKEYEKNALNSGEMLLKQNEEIKKLKEENQRMSRFLQSREIKYCEKCREYNEETEGFGYNGVFQNSEGEWVCDDCHEEEEEEICCECKREKKGPGDMFVTDVDINRVKTVRCGECALSFYKSK